jgi:3-hydroxyacyl-CoA dehydrogenase
MTIKKVAVLGSGVMGSGIAAHIANAGYPVLLLDIVLPGKGRNELTEKAVERQLANNPSGFTHKSKAKLITCGNLEDDHDKLKDVDWIVEAVLEKLDVKQGVYKKIDSVRKKGSVVSSNTSTIPLHVLLGGLSEEFQKDFMITHFFNPPRFMRLLEMVPGPKTRKEAYEEIRQFADIALGKGVVDCKDTPGFIANRIGVYWLMVGLLDAMKMNVPVEVADAVMGRPAGIPKTGIFGLFDLIGIDLMPLIAKEMLATLPESDPFRVMYQEPELVKKMIADGYTGRKGKGGFYRLNKQGEKKIKEAIDLATGEYRVQAKPDLESAKARSVADLIKANDLGGQYARSVLLKTLAYSASLMPEISDDIISVDNTMKWGYNWKSGPFEMIDKIGVDAFADALKAEGIAVPAMIEKAKGKKLYDLQGDVRTFYTLKGDHAPLPKRDGVWSLADKKLGKKPVLKNGSASLWDLGDGVACLEFTSKMNSIDPDILTLANQSIEKVKTDFKGLVIGSDADNFSVGANLAFILYAANMAAWPMISDVIRQGQNTMMALKYAPFPVVGALGGMALGGGCEFILHCDAVQANIESYPGLVEVGVGVIPGWGGCKEMLLRHAGGEKKGGLMGMITGGSMPALTKVFELIGTAKVAGSADDARENKVLNDASRISMNRMRLLPDAKALCLELANGYRVPEPATISLPGGTAKVAMLMAVKGMKLAGKITPHDEVVAKALSNVLSGGDTDSSEQLTEQQLLDLEHSAFMELVTTKGTLDRIEYMLENGKPLRN